MAVTSLALSSLKTARSSLCSRCLFKLHLAIRATSTHTNTTTSSPLLAQIKQDIKTAMRAKDTSRLNVLRAIISETNQAASGPNPVASDLQLLALLKKRKASSVAASQEAEKVGRTDLKEKQDIEITILDEYAGNVRMMGEREMRDAVSEVVNGFQTEDGLKPGLVMKELLKPGGVLDGKAVDKKLLSEIVRDAISTKPEDK